MHVIAIELCHILHRQLRATALQNVNGTAVSAVSKMQLRQLYLLNVVVTALHNIIPEALQKGFQGQLCKM
jgi:hypothetical protein